MDLNAYQQRAEDFIIEISREFYTVGAGLKDRLEIAAIYDRYADLFAESAVRGLLDLLSEARDQSDGKEARYLAEFAVGGSRLSLGTAGAAAVLIMTIGVTLGAISGYYGGWIDAVLMRVVDILLSFPSLVLALAIVGMLGPGVVNAMVGLVAVWWVSYARVVRGLVLSIRERPYVEAARTIGATDRRVVWRYILPNIVPPVIVLVTLEMGQLILAIAGLNFLGLGARPPMPEWGAMLNEGRPFLQSASQLMVYPGLAISLTVLSFNLLGDGMRDAFDPRLRER